MATAAELSILISARDQASKTLKGVQDALGGIGKAATAPIKALGGVGNALADIAKVGAGVALGGGIAALAGSISGVGKAMITGNAEMERYETQLGTLLGGADKAKERLAELAKFGATTPFELPEVVRAEKVLLGFGLTGQKALDLTKKSGADLRTVIGDIAAGTGASFEEVALTFGKFSAGATGEAISRLQEMGVVTREQLSDMGIQFSKSGELISPLPEAMAAAVQIAESKFGGGMDALSKTFEGQMSTLMDNWNALVRTIGQPIFEALKPQLAALNELLGSEGFQAGLKAFADFLANSIGQGVAAASAALGPFIAMLPDLATAFQQVITFMQTGSGDIEKFRGVLNALIGPQGTQAVIEVFTNLVGFFRTSVMPLWESLASAAQKALGGDLGGALQEAGAALGRYGAELVTSLAGWAKRFVEWVAPFVPPMLAELGRMLQQLGNWLATVALPAIASQLLEWGKAFVTWVAPLIPPLLVELGRLYIELQKWLAFVALPAIVSELMKWGAAFVGWVATEVMPHLPGALATVQKAVVDFLIAAGPIVLTEAGKVGKSLLDGFMAEAGKLAGQAWDAIAGDTPTSLKTKLYDALKAAIDNAVSGVKKWIDDLISPFRDAWNKIKDLLDKIRGGRREAEAPPAADAAASAYGASRLGMTSVGVGTQNVTIIIDAAGQNPQQIAAAVTSSLATLSRTRVTAGVA